MTRITPARPPHTRLLVLVALAAAATFALAGASAPQPVSADTAPTVSTLAAEESSATTPAPVPELPLPLQMARTGGGAGQMVIVTGTKLGSTTGTLRVFDLVDGIWVEKMAVPARFGTYGLVDGTLRRQGSRTTPTGIWRMPSYVFGTHTLPPTGTKTGYRQVNSRSWWSSRAGATYNTWVQARRWSGERLANYPKAYEFALSTGYNELPNQRVYGRGTAIFLHVRGTGLTAGCVSIARNDMVRVCRILDKRKRAYFAIGTLQRDAPTSIWAY